MWSFNSFWFLFFQARKPSGGGQLDTLHRARFPFHLSACHYLLFLTVSGCFRRVADLNHTNLIVVCRGHAHRSRFSFNIPSPANSCYARLSYCHSLRVVFFQAKKSSSGGSSRPRSSLPKDIEADTGTVECCHPLRNINNEYYQ